MWTCAEALAHVVSDFYKINICNVKTSLPPKKALEEFYYLWGFFIFAMVLFQGVEYISFECFIYFVLAEIPILSMRARSAHMHVLVYIYISTDFNYHGFAPEHSRQQKIEKINVYSLFTQGALLPLILVMSENTRPFGFTEFVLLMLLRALCRNGRSTYLHNLLRIY